MCCIYLQQNHIKRQEEAEYGGNEEDWMEVSLGESSIEGRRRGSKVRGHELRV